MTKRERERERESAGEKSACERLMEAKEKAGG